MQMYGMPDGSGVEQSAPGVGQGQIGNKIK